MGAVTKSFNFADAQTAESSAVNQNFAELYAVLNSNINSENLQASGVTGPRIKSSAVTIAVLADSAVTSEKFADSAITIAKRVTPVVNTAGLNPSAGGIVFSVNCTQHIISATAAGGIVTDISGLTLEAFSRGGPIEVQAITAQGQTGFVRFFRSGNINSTINWDIYLTRGSASEVVASWNYADNAENSNVTPDVKLPVTMFRTVDNPGSGSHTYKIQVISDVGQQQVVEFNNCKLMAREL